MTFRPLVRIGAALAACVVLASCRVESRIALEVEPNGSGTVSVAVTADKDIVDKVPGLAADVRVDDLKKAGWTVDGPSPTKAGGLTVTLRRRFDTPAQATAVLAQVNGSRGPLHDLALTRAGKDVDSTWKLTGRLEVNGGLSAFADDAALDLLGGAPYAAEVEAAGLDLGDAIGIDFTLSMPGKVESSTGTASGSTIEWKVPTDGSALDVATVTRNTDVAASVSRVGRHVLLALLVLWIVAVAVLALMVAQSRNRRGTSFRG